jgi:hypothetical protein
LCLRISQTEWNRIKQWTRINGMRIANWNVRTLYREGPMTEMMKEMDKRNIYIYIYTCVCVCVCVWGVCVCVCVCVGCVCVCVCVSV